MLNHEYDGIIEHDNFLPRWWLAILYGSIVFSILYVAYYELGSGPTLVEEYERAVDRIALLKRSQGTPTGGGESEESLAAWAAVDEHKRQGGQVFASKCASCHGAKGEGGIGPNLTDDYWIHGPKRMDLSKVIHEGVLDKGMPPWGPVLSPEDIKSVIAHIGAIHGSNPPNAKAPQGSKSP